MKRLRETMAAQATAKPAVDPMSPTGDRFPSRPKMSQEALDKGGGGVRKFGVGEDPGRDIDKAPRHMDVQTVSHIWPSTSEDTATDVSGYDQGGLSLHHCDTRTSRSGENDSHTARDQSLGRVGSRSDHFEWQPEK